MGNYPGGFKCPDAGGGCGAGRAIEAHGGGKERAGEADWVANVPERAIDFLDGFDLEKQ